MPDRRLYRITLPEALLQGRNPQTSRRIASETVLQSDVAEVEGIAPNSEDLTLSGEMFGELVDVTADELRELFASEAYSPIPLVGKSGVRVPDAGYYEPADGRIEPRDARERRIQRPRRLQLTHAGDIASYWRAIRTFPTTEDNPFGSASTAEIGLSARARKVRWFDGVGDTNNTESATVQRTVEGEHGEINIYDATEPSFDSPSLIFRLDYHHEWRTGARVWDRRGREKYYEEDGDGAQVGSATVGDTATVGQSRTPLQWQQVFVTKHDFENDVAVVETDRLRLQFDEANQQLQAYRWEPDDSVYEIVALGNSSWRLWDLDLLTVSQCRVDAQVEFEDTSAASLTTHNLNMSAKRGYDDVLWLNPDNEGAVPQGLKDRLDPIAHGSQEDPAAAMDIIRRTEVNP
jgi:hypothetical protein